MNQQHAPSDRDDPGQRRAGGGLAHAGAGLQFALTFLLFGLVGWWLDGKWGTSPWLLICGIALGAAGGMYSLVVRLGARPARKVDEGEHERR